ncbi:GH32 C-terminal domain-containing protein, partial [Streptomyces hayashii]|uniref:GH32 C-terminal domain-containing protein n=1 Tax=Streptomyces hayashii TaxID=2839966 RepID=UPI00403C29A4
ELRSQVEHIASRFLEFTSEHVFDRYLDGSHRPTKYRSNPVIDIGSRDFRDPKVQWYEPTKSWLMTVSLSAEHKVRFYSSKDLKNWTQLSEFGPAGATGGVWECPDLFPLAVDGDTNHVKWVLVVNINPGGIAGGSAAQYFVGDFDGTKFTAEDDGAPAPPAGTVMQDFEGAGFGAWTATGTAFGPGPAAGTLDGQQTVAGFDGKGLANSFHSGDATTGTLTSPSFTVASPYLNFKIGGGRHPHQPGKVLADFEGTSYGDWTTTGDAFGSAPATGALPDQQQVSGFQGGGLVDTYRNGDAGTGTLTSPEFTVDKRYVNFLIGGGNHPTGSAGPTALELLVDGQVVRSATGSDSETLDWASFDMRPYLGKKAQIQLVDMNTGGWGHILADQFTAADSPALSVLQRAHWADYGKDYYAAVSWENAPGGKRYMIGWMNNWDYAGAVPTSPWRGAQSIPRQMALRTVDGRVRLTSEPVNSVKALRQASPATATAGVVTNTSKALAGPAADGKALDIEATFSLKDAERFGLKVRTGTAGEETVIGYDTTTQELYVDRTHSGAVDFNGSFPGVQTAPLKAVNGKIKVRILVDWSSVEVFGGDGEAVITDQIFPDPADQGVRVFAENGSVKLDKATVWHLDATHD